MKPKDNLIIRQHASKIIGLITVNSDIWGLTERQVTIIEGIDRGKTFGEIADEIGFHRETVIQDFNRSLRMVRRKIVVFTNIVKNHRKMKEEMVEMREQFKMMQNHLPKGHRLSGALVRIRDVDMSTRLINALRCAEIRTLNEIDPNNLHELYKYRNFGKKSMNELICILKEYGFA